MIVQKAIIKYWNIYGFLGIIRLCYYKFFTYLTIPNAKLIRFPIEIRGKKYIEFGNKLSTGRGCRIEAYPYIKEDKIIRFGKNIELNDYVHITGIEDVNIGNDVLIASKVYISDSIHGHYSGSADDSSPESIVRTRRLSSKRVCIEDNVWIGESVSILAGVKIGKSAIIGANSVVTKDIPDYTIAAGNPAKPIKQFNFLTKQWERISSE